MAVLKAIIRWLLAAILGMAGLGALSTGDFKSALIMLAGCAVISPPGGAWVGSHVKALANGTRQVVAGMVVVFVGILFGVAGGADNATLAVAGSKVTPKPAAPPAPKFTCEVGQSADGAVVNVIGAEGHDLRSSPEGDKIVNRKATKALGETHYQTIDNTTKVQVQCIEGDWARIQITSPEWLISQKGWVERTALALPLKPGEKRTFTAIDFDWDKYTAKDKDMIIKAVNRIHREDPRCADAILPSLTGWSEDQSKARGKRTYFVNCGVGDKTVNVYFDADRVEDPTPFRAPSHVDQGRAVELCETYAKSQASHPSTVEFSRFMDLAVSEHVDGRTQIFSSFKAKNSFNLELKFDIRCLLDENGFIEGSISEAR